MLLRLALAAAIPALAAASVPVQPQVLLDDAAKRAQAEAVSAEERARQLQKQATEARDEASRLRARQLAAAEEIIAAEARITAADAELKMIAATIAERRRRLEEEQRPISSLLAGLVLMGQRPPLLAIADSRSSDELVQVQLLVESTMPAIRRRTAALAADLEQGRRLELAAVAARASLSASRDALARRQREFAALESAALAAAARHGSEAMTAGDVAIAAGEEAERLGREGREARSGARVAAELARLGPAPPRPGPATQPPRPPLDYRLPADSVVTDGYGSISSGGIRSRGITLGTARGTRLAAPASGIIRFAGPFRSHDGIIIIDHGRGWMSLILNAASSHERGARIAAGEPLGLALGPIVVELSHDGRRVSPALIAGSSASLSNRREEG